MREQLGVSIPRLQARLRERLAGVQPEAQLTALMVIAFLGVTVWWLTQETRVPDFDSATHTFASFAVRDEIVNGKWTTPFTEFNTYPPLGHLIGAFGVLIGGYSTGSVILALNLVFVPLLAAGCYGAGRLVAGPRAGLFAAVFALGTPMIVSEAHEAYLDPAQAAFVARFPIRASMSSPQPMNTVRKSPIVQRRRLIETLRKSRNKILAGTID